MRESHNKRLSKFGRQRVSRILIGRISLHYAFKTRVSNLGPNSDPHRPAYPLPPSPVEEPWH